MKRLLSFLLCFLMLPTAISSETLDYMPDTSFTPGIEGPAIDSNGYLYAVNFKHDGTIGKVIGQGKGEVFIELPNGSIGNGIRFDIQGNMYIADYINHNILIVKQGSAQAQVFAHNNQMNQPNDLAIASNGTLFASDPNWQAATGNLWRIDLNGATTLLEADMGTTNGIEVSPDDQYLYVNESVQRKVWRYRLDAKGNISEKTLFYQFDRHGLDGMRTDITGNLYIARYGAGVVAVLSPEGRLIKEYQLTGQHPTNIAFGGENGKQVFVTMQKRGAIETFMAEHRGRSHAILH